MEAKEPPKIPKKESVGDKVLRQMASPRSGHLNSWATWAYFRALGGRGFPSWEDCHGATHNGVLVADPPMLDPQQVKELARLRFVVEADGHQESIPLYVDSGRLFDATPKKYEPAALAQKVDARVLDSVCKVEVAMSKLGSPPVLRAYLMFLYPQWGRFVPVRPEGWREDTARAFLDTEAAQQWLLGRCRGAYLDRNARGLVANLAAELFKEVGK
jgi:hypothetical protein